LRVAAAAAAALVLTGPIAVALLSRVTNTVTVPLAADDRSDWKPLAVKMLSPRLDRQHTLPMFVAAPATLLKHPRVAILLATYGGTPTLDEAVLEWTDGSCAYRSAPGAALENNQTLDLIKDDGCKADPAQPANLRLTVRVRERGEQIAVWVYEPQPGVQPPELLRIWEGNPGTRAAGIVRGAYVEPEGTNPRRLELFNYVWNIAADPTWIWATLLVAGLFAALSVWLLTAAVQNTARGFFACASLAFALGLLYATFVPPLQAPDEPAHLLAFANSTGRPQMADAARALARRGHLWRLRFHGDERFRPSDIGRPSMTEWPKEQFAHDVEGRSLTTFWWWKATSWSTRGLTTPRTLLTARLANGVLFSVTIGMAALLFAFATPPAGARLLLPIVLLLIPTLPFFATHLSEFALLTDAYILFAASLCVLLADGPMVHRIGLPLGASLALALLSGRSAAPILALFLAALAGRVLLGQRAGTPRTSAVFWASCGAGLFVFPAFVSQAFSNGLWPGDTSMTAAGWFRQTAELLRIHPTLLLAAVPIGYIGESIVHRLPSMRESPLAQAAAASLSYGLAAMVTVSLALSLLVPFPMLATRELAPPATVEAYARDVLAVGLTSLRLRRPDLLLSASFWGGFGWIDAVLPAGLVIALTTIVAAGLVLTGLSIARRRDARQTVWVVMLGAGGTAALAAYAVSNYFVNRNLHGRYLVGLYLATLLAAWTVPILDRERPSPRTRLVVVAAVIAIHAYALPFVLLRYF
jgi:hypothetical protein